MATFKGKSFKPPKIGFWRVLGLLPFKRQFNIRVDNIEASIQKVITNGGKIVQPVGMDAPEVTARFTDPAGNIIGLYQEPHS